MINPCYPRRTAVVRTAALALSAVTAAAAATPAPPGVGDAAKDFTLDSVAGGTVTLSNLTAVGPVVLVVLRGYPGYQCPYCTKQFAEYLSRSADFARAGAQVVFVYPGPSSHLKDHAAEFVHGRDFPAGFHLLLDPDYTFTDAYGLRWTGPKETAYPSTLVVAADRKIIYANVSHTHGGRAAATEVLAKLPTASTTKP